MITCVVRGHPRLRRQDQPAVLPRQPWAEACGQLAGRLGQARSSYQSKYMQKAMGPLPAPAAAPLDLRVSAEVRLNKYTRRRITFLSEPGDHVPAYLLTPQERTGRLPALLCLPASSEAGKQVPAGLEGSK